jgi:hypothetical protein
MINSSDIVVGYATVRTGDVRVLADQRARFFSAFGLMLGQEGADLIVAHNI